MSSKRNCPHCQKQTSIAALHCSHCGKDLDTPPKPETKPVPLFLVIILSVIGLGFLFTVFLISQGASSEPPIVETSTPSLVEVTYRVTGSVFNTDASITIENATGGTEQANIKMPWEHKMVVERGQFVYIAVQNEHDVGAIECEILIDGEPWKHARSVGGFAIASCDGGAGE